MNQPDVIEQHDRRAQILEAALEVFSTKGFHQATNKDIAKAAGGISPGLIYWYFKDKEDLFLSLIRERVQILQLLDHPEQFLELPPREGLGLLAQTYLGMFREPRHRALLRIVLGEVSRFPQIGEMFYRVLASRFFRLITDYFQRQVDLGRFRPHDVSVSARSFIGTLVVQILAREILRQPEALETSDDMIIVTIIDIFVRGLESEAQP